MAGLAQLVRASGCGSEGRGFDPHNSPQIKIPSFSGIFYLINNKLVTKQASRLKLAQLHCHFLLEKSPLLFQES